MAHELAAIWDMDGVIADTGPYHLQAWQYVFHKRGIDFTTGDFTRNFGRRNDAIIKDGLGREPSKEEIKTIATEKENKFRSLVKPNIKALPGTIELITSLNEHKFKLAISSSAPPENIKLITQSLDIAKYFHALVSGHEVSEGKPSPQGFLLAAQKLGVAPQFCVVFEDAVAGVEAAKRGGMRAVAITNTNNRKALAAADIIVDSLTEITVKDVEKLITD